MSTQAKSSNPVIIHGKVKWGDCDPAGVVYTPRFGDYVIEASLEFLEILCGSAPNERFKSIDVGLPAKAFNIEFRNSLRPNQLFDMAIYVSGVRHRTFDLDFVATSTNSVVLFVARLTLICIKASAWESQPLPPALREKLMNYHDRWQMSDHPPIDIRVPFRRQ